MSTVSSVRALARSGAGGANPRAALTAAGPPCRCTTCRRFPPAMLESAPPPEPPQAKVYRPRAAGAFARCAVALACFVLVGLGLRAVAAPGGGSVIGGKLEYWRAHGGE